MSENKITFPAKLASNNPQSFGIADATEISGHKSVDTLSGLYAISDPVLSILKDGSDAIGQEWFVVSEDCKYRLDNWANRKSVAGWTKLPKQELVNTKQSVSEKDQPSGYAGLDSNGKIPIEKTYGDTATVTEVKTYESLPVTGSSGVIYYVSNTSAQYKWSGSAYIDITDGADNAKKNETSIFDCSNGTSTKYYASLSAAINVVPPVYRTSNRIISYLSKENATTTAVNYQYHGIDSTTWTDLTKWERVPNQADLTEIRSDLSEINENIKNTQSQEFIYSIIDSDERVLLGIKQNGEFFIPDDLLPENILNKISLKINVSDIVDSLLSNDANKPLSAKQGNILKLLIDALSTSLSAISSSVLVVSNSEFAFAVIDADQKVLFGIRHDGSWLEKKSEEEEVLVYSAETNDYVFLLKDSEEKVILGIRSDNSLDFPALNAMIKKIYDDFPSISNNSPKNEFDESIGLKTSYGSVVSEKEATSLTSDSNILLDDYTTRDSSLVKKHSKLGRIVAINHDDLPIYDYVSIRKLLNKYKFKSTFSYILTIFRDVQHKEEAVANIKKMVLDGNEITFHAIIQDTSPYHNPLYETKPNDKTNFAPSLEELKPIGESGINELGYQVDSNSKFSSIGFTYPALDITIASATEEQYSQMLKKYVVWNNLSIMSGLDLNDAYVSKNGILEWVEYWYNNLVEDIGYSTYSGTTLERFMSDYDFPDGEPPIEYYPDLSHVKKGKLKYYQNIGMTTKYNWFAWKSGSKIIYTQSSNPNTNDIIYSDTDLTESQFLVSSSDGVTLIDNQTPAVTYRRFSHLDMTNHLDANGFQSVGKFTKGLYKDCYTNMNGEVVDRLLIAVKAYMKYYFDYNELVGYTAHGGYRATTKWVNDSWCYHDRELLFLQSEATKVYSTRTNCYRSLYDIMLSQGMKIMQNSPFHTNGYLEGQTFLYEGQRDIRPSNLYSAQMPNPVSLAYPELYSDGTGDYAISTLSEVKDVFDKVDNWGRYLIDNANKTVAGNSGTSYVLSSNFREWIERTVATLGTGKVPQFTFDTIKNSAGMKMILEMFYQFCYKNDIEVVGYNQAREIMINTPKPYKPNYFPNPSFRQTIKETYNTVSERSKMPDGFKIIMFDDTLSTINVGIEDVVINANTYTNMVLSVFKATFATRVYALPPSKYRFSCFVKTEYPIQIGVLLRKNLDFYDNYTYSSGDLISVPATDWVEVSYDFEIKHPYIAHDNSPSDVVCGGYHNNVSNILITFNSGDQSCNFKISNPIIKTI